MLIAEDNEMNRAMIRDLFKELELEVYFAVNGIEAVEKTKELNPDIILMDIHMPQMDGKTATKKIRQIPEFKNIPIVALSADAFMEQQKSALYEIKKLVNIELEKLSTIPVYNFEEIDEQIETIRKLSKKCNSNIVVVLKKIETAAFAGNIDQLEELFKFRLAN